MHLASGRQTAHVILGLLTVWTAYEQLWDNNNNYYNNNNNNNVQHQ